ncbi:MAG: hypothetical protein KGJ07_03500 [Patescibacteria group bacterium]|nr:hypothetical protein [Patescibacteria group bacterium]MDE2588994.1 hypothetical protein [Patescibacteria group bacterium]
MKKFFRHIREDKLLFWSFVLSAVLLMGSVMLIGIFFQRIPPYLPLFNSLPWGYARVGSKITFFLPVLIGWIAIISNTIISSIIYEKIVLLARFIGGTTILVCTSILIFTIQILLVIH